MEILSKVVVVLASLLSAVVLLVSLRLANREVRVRAGLEWARIAVGIGGAVLLGVIVGVQTPWLLAIAAIAIGGVIGYMQGLQTIVSIRESKLWAKRTIWGIALWSAGLIAMQLAGLGSRTGMFKIGQTISLFSMSIALGLIIGRPRDATPKPVVPAQDPS